MRPAPPVDPDTNKPLTPGSVTRTNYLSLAEQYGAEGVEPPPPQIVVITKAIAREFPPDRPWAFVNDDLEVPRGHQAFAGSFRWGAYRVPGAWTLVIIGQTPLKIRFGNPPPPLPAITFFSHTSKIGISAVGTLVLALTLNLRCIAR